MTDTTEKYLTLRGANNDIYFFQKRVSEKVANIIGTSFVKTSLRTKDINEAIFSRDELVDALYELENSDILDISDHFRRTLDTFGIYRRKRSGSNRQPSHRQCDALPIELLFPIG